MAQALALHGLSHVAGPVAGRRRHVCCLWIFHLSESLQRLQALQEECPNSPWRLTFSYGRALQSATLKTWAGNNDNTEAAHDILVRLAKANSEAQQGKYKGPHPVPGGGRILQALRFGGPGK